MIDGSTLNPLILADLVTNLDNMAPVIIPFAALGLAAIAIGLLKELM